MPEEMFLKILSELREINYSGMIFLYRYNESFADMPLMLKRIQQTREYLPQCYIHNSSNGDYLKSMDDIYKTFDAGMDCTYVKIYLNKDEEYKLSVLEPKMNALMTRLGLEKEDGDLVQRYNEGSYTVEFIPSKYPNKTKKLFLEINNFAKFACNRGGSLDDFKKEKRSDVCAQSLHDLDIDYDGYAMPCCHVRYDIDSHKCLALGNVAEKTIFEIFCGKKVANLRKSLFLYGIKPEPCEYCDSYRYCDEYKTKGFRW
jgi:hypothetical protein